MNITKEILEDIIKNSNSLKEIYVKLNFSETSKSSLNRLKILCNHFNIPIPYQIKKERIKRSPVWIIDILVLKEIIKNSFTYTEILIKLGYTNTNGRTCDALKKRILKENISITHFNSGKNSSYNKQNNENHFVKNGSLCRSSLKKRILKQELKENICEICKQPPFWNGKPMVLILDHINGIYNDNRLENLRLVCPNCNSQLDTTNGKNVNQETIKERVIKVEKLTLFDILIKNKYTFNTIKKPLLKTISILNKSLTLNKKEKNIFCKCGKIKIAHAKLCRECYDKSRQTKERPSIEELKKFAETKIYGELIGHIYQSTTSGNTISNQGIFVNNGNITIIQKNTNSIKDNKIIINGKEIKSEYQKTLEKIDKNNPNWCN